MDTPPFTTVADAVRSIGKHWPGNGYTFQSMDGEETTFSFPALERTSAAYAAALQSLGLKKGDRIALIITEPRDFVLTFLASLRLGLICVPLYPPFGMGNLSAYSKRNARILDVAGASVIVASSRLKYLLWALVDQVSSVRALVTVETLGRGTGEPVEENVEPDDIAFLQFTSGSTMDPRGVSVTHACLLANTEGITGSAGLQIDPRLDKGVCWLPLYHDMGLVGFVIATICRGISVVFIPTLRFLREPRIWMDAIHRHRASISFGPNFAYALAARRATEEDLLRWDLSCVRVLGCGGEPVNPRVVRAFTDKFHERCGLPQNVVRPGYGLAEGVLTTSLTPMEHGMKTIVVDARAFERSGEVVSPRDGEPTLEHVSVGRIIPGHEVTILDKTGQSLAEGHEGEIVMRGPSVTPGYFNDPEATADNFRDGALYTGDFGFLLDGYLYVTGRIKDLIIYNGRNIHPQSIEWAASEVDGVRKGSVAAFSVRGEDTERIVVVLEVSASDPDRLARDVKNVVMRELAVPVQDVVCVGPGELPKTSSGKLQRRKARTQYLEAALGSEGSRTSTARVQPVRVAGHVARSLWTMFRHSLGFNTLQ